MGLWLTVRASQATHSQADRRLDKIAEACPTLGEVVVVAGFSSDAWRAKVLAIGRVRYGPCDVSVA